MTQPLHPGTGALLRDKEPSSPCPRKKNGPMNSKGNFQDNPNEFQALKSHHPTVRLSERFFNTKVETISSWISIRRTIQGVDAMWQFSEILEVRPPFGPGSASPLLSLPLPARTQDRTCPVWKSACPRGRKHRTKDNVCERMDNSGRIGMSRLK